MSERRSRFDNQRGLGAGCGVPALAGRALSLGDGSKYWEMQGETPSHRLKPGLHTLRLFSIIRDAACQKANGIGHSCPRSEKSKVRAYLLLLLFCFGLLHP